MTEELGLYFESLINEIPLYIFKGLLMVLCIGSVVFLFIKGRNAWRDIKRLLLVDYIILIYCTAVIFRNVKEVREYNYAPFWSYDKPEFMTENIMNVLMFVPVGLLLGLTIKNMNWWKALLVGGGLSISIELLQLVFKRGFSEVDDLMHNTLGCMIGYRIYTLMRVGYEKIRRNMGVL